MALLVAVWVLAGRRRLVAGERALIARGRSTAPKGSGESDLIAVADALGTPHPQQTADATVPEWYHNVGWGVLDSPETPGGCWTRPPSVLSMVRRVLEYEALSTAEKVDLEWETPGQDGFDYRAVAVRHHR